MSRTWQRRFVILVALLLLGSVALTQVSAQADGWQASYWNNTLLSGAPVITRVDPQINFNWGSGSPHPSINADNFSARWTRTVNLTRGVYEFTMRTDNGGRLYVNNQLVLSEWWDHPPRTDTVRVSIAGGNVPIRMEMYERTFAAEAQLSWRKVSDTLPPTTTPPRPTATPTRRPPTATPTRVPPTATPQPSGVWLAQYYDNVYLTGSPILTRRETQIDNDWGFGSPAPGVPNDHFSVRWTGVLDLPIGTYRFSTITDDGVMMWINNQLLINQWFDHSAQFFDTIYRHGGGPLPVRVEYYERTGSAVARVGALRIGDLPTQVPPPPTAAPTAVPTATPLPNAGTCTIYNVYVLNVRQSPSLNSAVVTRVVRGEVTTFTGLRSGAWMQIRTAAGVTGWINYYYCLQGPVR